MKNYTDEKPLSVVSVRRISVAPTPVYDATVPVHHNFMLGNGVIVHNTAKKARNTNYQEVFRASGKPPNGVRQDLATLVKSKPVQNFFVALGYNHKLPDPYKGLRVGKIFLLADADPDGPLIGSTRVMMADGTTPTIESLWNSSVQTVGRKVLALDGMSVAAREIEEVVRVQVDRYVEITFACGNVERCSVNHDWVVPAQGDEAWDYRAAKDLSVGDRVLGTNSVLSDMTMLRSHEITSIKTIVPSSMIYMYCLVVPSAGNFIAVGSAGFGLVSSNCHINALFLSLIWRFIPKMIEDGRVYICNAPLYSAFWKGERYFGRTFDECYKQIPKGAPKHCVTRAKGWGELAPEMLEVLAFLPDTRNTIKVTPSKGKDLESFKGILGSDTSFRKELLGLN